jgi:hypothetical protein
MTRLQAVFRLGAAPQYYKDIVGEKIEKVKSELLFPLFCFQVPGGNCVQITTP